MLGELFGMQNSDHIKEMDKRIDAVLRLLIMQGESLMDMMQDDSEIIRNTAIIHHRELLATLSKQLDENDALRKKAG